MRPYDQVLNMTLFCLQVAMATKPRSKTATGAVVKWVLASAITIPIWVCVACLFTTRRINMRGDIGGGSGSNQRLIGKDGLWMVWKFSFIRITTKNYWIRMNNIIFIGITYENSFIRIMNNICFFGITYEN